MNSKIYLATKRERVWKILNPIYLKHRMDFIYHHFAYENIFWDKLVKKIHTMDTDNFQQNLINFSVFSDVILSNSNNGIDVLNNVGCILESKIRDVACPALYTQWGTEAPSGNELYLKINEWYEETLEKIKSPNRKIQLEILLDIENLLPWEFCSGFLSKIVWNIFRVQMGYPIALIPIENKKLFFKHLILSEDNLIPNNNMF